MTEGKSIYTLLPSALFSYIDHIELQYAREAASKAQRWAVRSMWVAIGSIIVQILTSTNEWTFNEVLKIIGAAAAWLASLALIGYIWDKVKNDL